MRRACLAIAFIICMCLGARTVCAEDLPGPWEVQRLTVDPATDRLPQVTLDAYGRALVAWMRQSSEAAGSQVLAARWPQWDAAAVQGLALSDSTPSLDVISGQDTHIAWWTRQPTVTVATLTSLCPIETDPQVIQYSVPGAYRLLAPNGIVHGLSIGPADLAYQVGNAPATTIPISSTRADALVSVTFALDRDSRPAFAWVLSTITDTRSLWVWPPEGDALLVRSANAIRGPQLVLDGAENAHLAWVESDGLHYAYGADWTKSVIISGASGRLIFSMAVDPSNVAHMTWFDGAGVWYANSSDWECSKKQFAVCDTVDGLDMAVDSDSVHIVWSSLDSDGNWDIHYASQVPTSLQVRVLAPLEGLQSAPLLAAVADVNQGPSGVSRVDFYLERAQQPGETVSTLAYLGSDGDGFDGWSVPIKRDSLFGMDRYRVVVWAMDRWGRLGRGSGAWFTVRQSGQRWVSLGPLGSDRAQPIVPVLTADSWDVRVGDVYATPLAGSISLIGDILSPISSQALYLGAWRISTEDWHYVPLNRSVLPDGQYDITVVASGAGEIGFGVSSSPLNLESHSRVTVSLQRPLSGAILTGNIDSTAEIHDPRGVVAKVEFFLERYHLVNALPWQIDPALGASDVRWLGDDDDGSDGWTVTAPIESDLRSTDWTVTAAAFDHQGILLAKDSTESIAIVGAQQTYLSFLAPAAGESLGGAVPIRIRSIQGADPLIGISLYYQQTDESLTFVDVLRRQRDQWVAYWPTAALDDGDYRLVAIGRTMAGRSALACVGPLSVCNRRSSFQFIDPPKDAVLSGVQKIQLTRETDSVEESTLALFFRDAQDELHAIDQAQSNGEQWCALWDTRRAIDGEYDLVALEATQDGDVLVLDRRVVVQNDTFAVQFRNLDVAQAWQGYRRVYWTVQPATELVDVVLQVSPDNGVTWIGVGESRKGSSSLLWDTTQFPDSSQARLRLIVTDGAKFDQEVSDVFVINNQNQGPTVELAMADPGTCVGPMLLEWDAYDPDGDPLRFDLEYRISGQAWIVIASDLADSSYVWRTEELGQLDNIDVRVVAHDPTGASAMDMLQALPLPTNRAPQVELLWPGKNAQLASESIILWRSYDPDDDVLAIDLHYSDDAGATWLPLAEGLPDTGYYSWQVSFLPEGSRYRVRIVAKDELCESADVSAGVFSIGNGAPTDVVLVSPVFSANVQGLQLVRWSQTDGIHEAVVSLAIKQREDESWTELAQIPDDGFYLWDTRDLADGEYLLQGLVSEPQAGIVAQFDRSVHLSNHRNAVPRVTLLADLNGRTLNGQQLISWRAWDADGDTLLVTCLLSTDGGASWQELTRSQLPSGSYLWDTQAIGFCSTCLLRIAATDGKSVGEEMFGPFRVEGCLNAPPQARFLSPTAAGRLEPDALVTWSATDMDLDPLTIDLAISDDNGITWRSLLRGVPDPGGYLLDPSELSAQVSYRLRISVTDQQHDVEVLSSPFELNTLGLDIATARLVSPRLGAIWSGEREIVWAPPASEVQPSTIDIQLSGDGGRTWRVLASDLANSGSFSWDTRNEANGTYRAKLLVHGPQFTTTIVGEPFVLNNAGRNRPLVSVVEPLGDQIWSGSRQISWRAQDADGDPLRIHLSYSVDDGANWRVIAYNIWDTGSYVVDTAQMPNCERILLRVTATDGEFQASDLCDRPIAVLNAQSPSVTLVSPVGGSVVAGLTPVIWQTLHGENVVTSVTIEYSLDQGHTWQTIDSELAPSGLLMWNTETLPANGHVWLRATARDRFQTGLDSLAEPVLVWDSGT